MRHIFALTLLFVFGVMLVTNEAKAVNIEKVESKRGIVAWLVEDHNVPLIAMQFAFHGGASQDSSGKEGTAYLLSGMLDEGAGDLKSTEFQTKVEELTLRLGFDASRDNFSGSFQTLRERKDDGFDLLKLALEKPRFDEDAVERVRQQILSSLNFDANNPQKVATKAWFKSAYPKHPYGRPTKGSIESVKAIQRDDLVQAHKKIFARENLKIAVVGAISAQELAIVLDQVFGDLPEKSGVVDLPDAEPVFGPVTERIEMGVPQSVVQFGHEGFKRSDKEFIAAYVLNYILGGGGFSSRLTEEVRSKRGLAYSIYSYLYPLRDSGLIIGGVATKNSTVEQVIGLIQSEFTRMVEKGPTAKELQDAKQYLTGSYALRFDTSSKIASQLLWIQVEGLGADYITKRNEMIEAVSMEEIRDIAKKLLQGDKLRFTVVGQAVEASN